MVWKVENCELVQLRWGFLVIEEFLVLVASLFAHLQPTKELKLDFAPLDYCLVGAP